MVESTEKLQATPELEETKDSAVAPADTEAADKQSKQVTEAQAGQDLTKLYIDLEEGVPTEEIESLCMECRKSGVTRFMYTKIPMFREIILSSFSCEHCGNRNTEVQFSGKLSDTGVKYSFTVTDAQGLNRSVVKSEFATIRIPELDFEIPPQTQKGSIKTIEGFFLTAIEGISELQEQRRQFDPETARKLDAFIEKLKEYRDGMQLPFTFELVDPSGNSFIQDPDPTNPDPSLKRENFMRTVEDFIAMGYNIDQAELNRQEEALKAAGQLPADSKQQDPDKKMSQKAVSQSKEEQEKLLAKVSAYAQRDADEHVSAAYMDFRKPIDDKENQQIKNDPNKEMMTFETFCYACSAAGEIRMCQATIPFFKEIIIMAFTCEKCGHRTSEIKQGGGISDKATRITFAANKPEDINRDVFKSDTCIVKVPELDLELAPGTLGSVYTTIEGLLQKVIDQMNEVNPFGQGDSKTNDKFVTFIKALEELKEGTKPFTLIMDDPLSNCFIYNPNAPEEDPKIKVEVYERTEEQNDELGITDMVV